MEGIQRIEEHVVEGRRLGRHIHHDPRSKNFPADQADAIRNVWHPVGAAGALPLNQGNLGSCTANALCGSLDCAPDYSGRAFIESDAYSLYQAEAKLEGYSVPPDDPGGTGLYVCKAAKTAGFISGYTHTFSLDAALKALVLRPILIGANWYEGFDTPDRHGTVKIAGQVRGGHEFVGVAISVARKAVACWNSWGPGWGPWGGRFWLPFDVLGRLLGEGGDVTVPVV